MKTLSAPTALATGRSYTTPIFLAELTFTAPSAKTLYLSDRYVPGVGGHDWLPLVQDWGTLESGINVLDVDGRPATATLTLNNATPIEGRARLSDLIRTLQNPSGYEWAFATCTLRQTFEGLTDSADLIPLGVFYLEDPTDIDLTSFAVRMSDHGLVIESALRVTQITRAEFPNCSAAQVGQSIPRAFGVLTNVPAVPVQDGQTAVLSGDHSSSTTTITLIDAADFAAGETILIDLEMILLGTKSGNAFTGCTRAVQSTTAAAHSDTTTVFEVRTGIKTYRYAVGEHEANFTTKAITNIRVNGRPPRTSPQVELNSNDLVSGKRFAVINFVPPNINEFHTLPLGGHLTRSISDVSLTLNLTQASSTTRTPSTSTAAEGVGTTHRQINIRVTRGGANLTGPVHYVRIQRNIAGLPQVQAFECAFATGVGGVITGTHTIDYPSLADETLTIQWSYQDTNDGALTIAIENYDVSGEGIAGGQESTAAHVIGDVTCDVQGIQDDSGGTISGTGTLLLENPADITKYILTRLYGVTALGSSWTTTRSRLAGGQYKWALRLAFDTFSRLRRQFGEQARSALYIEAGQWEYQFLEDAPVAALTLDYDRDVWDGEPAQLRRSARVDVKNSLAVSSQQNHLTGAYKSRVVYEDLSVIANVQATELELPWVQDAATADLLGTYWLSVWRRQRFSVELSAWWNVAAVTKIDYFRLQDHPILAAHGDTSVVFRVLRRDDRIADGRIHLQGVEAAILPLPRDPQTGEDMICNCRLRYVNSTTIRLDPYNGNQIRVKVSGTWQVGTVPDAGVTKDTTGLSASTLYYVYAYDNAGTLTLELSTTGHSRDTTTGLEVKTGDDTRLLVGLIRTNGSTQFADSATQRFVRSLFNPQNAPGLNTFSADRSTSSTTYVEVNSEIRVEFVLLATESVFAAVEGSIANSSVAYVDTAVGFDGTTAEAGFEAIGVSEVATASRPIGGLAGKKSGLSEGYHYATLLGKVSAGTGVWHSSTTGGQAKVYLHAGVER